MVPEQFVELLGGGGVVDKFRLSEQKKTTQDGPGPPRIDKDLIRSGPRPSGWSVVHPCFGVTIALRDLSQLLHARMQPKCRVREEIYECSHEKDASTKARTF